MGTLGITYVMVAREARPTSCIDEKPTTRALVIRYKIPRYINTPHLMKDLRIYERGSILSRARKYQCRILGVLAFANGLFSGVPRYRDTRSQAVFGLQHAERIGKKNTRYSQGSLHR